VYTDRDGSKCRKDAAGHTTGRVQLRNNIHVLCAPDIERSIAIVEETDVGAQEPTEKSSYVSGMAISECASTVTVGKSFLME
jgi:hypothetical protein